MGVGQVRDVLMYYSAAPERLIGQQIPVPGGLNVTFHEPVGVVVADRALELPHADPVVGHGPRAGRGLYRRGQARRDDPADTRRIGSLALEAGLPEGVFQVPLREGQRGRAAAGRPPRRAQDRLHRVTEVGQSIMAGARGRSSGSPWNSGARAPTSSSPTPTWSGPAATAPYAVFDNAGQDCCARSRVLVQRSVFDRFMELFETAVQGVAVGDPASAATEMGPLISAAHRATRGLYVPDDAPVAFRGYRASGPGWRAGSRRPCSPWWAG